MQSASSSTVATRLVRGLINYSAPSGGCVATLGTFDGVHLGHKAILQQLRELAAHYQAPSVVIVFEPQPQEFFLGEKAPARLTPMREKVQALLAAGIDQVVCLAFNEQLRNFTAEDFVREILLKRLRVRHLVIGDDFRFGCDREGDFALLTSLSHTMGFGLSDNQTFEIDGERVSSTRVRSALEAGDFAKAEALLGKPYCMSGKIVYGQQLGRQLGVPTANVRLRRYRSPLQGVFAVRVTFADGERFNGVANIGIRPSVDGAVKPLLEVHLFDFSRNVYGKHISVEFCLKLRNEQKFASLDALQAQLQQDIAAAKHYFAAH